MATYDNLPVYKQTYDLLLQLYRLSQNMERDYRYTIGENLKKELITLMINVYRANCREDKEKTLLANNRANGRSVRCVQNLTQTLSY